MLHRISFDLLTFIAWLMKSITFPPPATSFLISVIGSLIGTIGHAIPFPDRTPGNKLTASDAADDDEFGYSIAQSGDLLVVGAHLEDGPGLDRGAAYVFDLRSGSQIFKLTAADAQDSDRFGLSVAVANRLCVVGAPEEDGDGTNRGSVYVFDLSTGEQQFKLVASDARDGDQFGYAVAVFGRRAIIGAWRAEGSGDPASADKGAAYIFDLVTGEEIARFSATDGENADYFGAAVAIFGNMALVGAYREDGGGSEHGAAYLYEIDTGIEVAKLTASDAGDLEFFGRSVALNDRSILVGAHRNSGGGSNRGAVYVFDFVTLEERFKLTASDAADNDEFGFSSCLSGDLAVVGAHLDAGNGGSQRGKAYAFDLVTGEELATFTAADAENADRFGISVCLEGDKAFVGAFREDGMGSSRGAAYGFVVPDVRPDNLIGSTIGSNMGKNVWNSSGTGQTVSAGSSRLAKVSAWLTVTANGNGSDDFRISGQSGDRDFQITYTRHHATQRANITASMIAGLHSEPNLDPVESGRLIRAEVTPSPALKKRVRKGKRFRFVYTRRNFVAKMTTVSETWSTRSDVVVFSVGTR